MSNLKYGDLCIPKYFYFIKWWDTKLPNEAYHYRIDPVPRTHKYRKNSYRYGRSKKGLEFATFRRMVDENVIIHDEENDIYETIKIFDKRIKKSYEYNWFSLWEPPLRYGSGRGWKSSKKRKQWMKTRDRTKMYQKEYRFKHLQIDE